MRRRHLHDAAVAKLRATGKRYNQPDTELPGHYVRVSPTGVKSYWVAARGPGQKNYTWKPIGSPPMGMVEARASAKKVLASIRASGAANSFALVSGKWRKLHVEARKLHSMDEIDRHLKRMSAAWDARDFASIGRGDLAQLLDEIEINNGPRQATYACKCSLRWRTGTQPATTIIEHHWSRVCAGVQVTKRDRILNDESFAQCGLRRKPTAPSAH